MRALIDNLLADETSGQISGQTSRSGYEDALRGIIGAAVLSVLIAGAEPLLFGAGFYETLKLHPFWIVILIASLQHGPGVGIASVALATFLMGWPDRFVGEDAAVYAARVAVLPLQWLVVALIVGLYSQRKILETEGLRAEVTRLEDVSDTLAAEIERMDSLVLDLERASAAKSGATTTQIIPDASETYTVLARALPDLAALAGARASELPATFEAASAALFDGPVALIAAAPGEDPLFIGSAPELGCSPEVMSASLGALLGHQDCDTVKLQDAGLDADGAARIVRKCAHVENGLTATVIFFAETPAEADAGAQRLDLIAEMARIAIDRVSLDLGLDKRAKKLSQKRG